MALPMCWSCGRSPGPSPGTGEVLIRVAAAGVDQGVWHLMAGLPYLIRLFGFGLTKPKVAVRGREVAGVVEAVGAGVTRFQPGTEVFGTCDGSFAGYALAKADKLAKKPSNLSFEESAAAPISGVTALQAVRDAGAVAAGQRVLVIGAGGGVGCFAVQVAKAFGAEVTGVCSTGKMELVRSLGADRVLDYTREDFSRVGVQYDASSIPPGTGRSLCCGGSQKLKGLVSTENHRDLEAPASLIEAGKIKPVVDKVYALADAPAAITYMHEEHPRGKVVISI